MSSIWFLLPFYLIFGFCFGIFREKAAQWILLWGMEYPSALRHAGTYICFPATVSGCDDDEDFWLPLTWTRMGIWYWLLIGIVWPATLIWLPIVTVGNVCAFVAEIVRRLFKDGFLSNLPFLASFEGRVRRFAGIQPR